MRRLSIVLVSLALLVVVLPMGVLAQAIPDVIGERFYSDKYPSINCHSTNSAFSPDGMWYAYSEYGSIYVVPVNGGKTLTFCDVDNDKAMNDADDVLINGYHTDGFNYGIDFSPDSSTLVVGVTIFDTTKGSTWEESYRDEEKEYTNTIASNGIPSIVTIDIYTGEISYIADGSFALWSNDGRYLFYKHFDYHYYTNNFITEHHDELVKYDLLTGDMEFIEPIIEPKVFDENVRTDNYTIGPNQEFFYFNAFKWLGDNWRLGEGTLMRIPINGGEVEELSEPLLGGACGLIQITSDGQWVLFSDNADIYIANLTTGEVFNALTYKIQNTSRWFTVTPPQMMRTFRDPQFFENETKIVYQTFTGRWVGDITDSELVNYPPLELPNGEENKNGVYIIDFDPANYIARGDDIISAVEEHPEAFLTLGAFPNPFNPSTTLQFTLPEAGHAELTVFNFAGQKVRTLADGEFSAGAHSVVWDGCDAHGTPVSSGVYLSRLTSRDNVVTSRMTLVK